MSPLTETMYLPPVSVNCHHGHAKEVGLHSVAFCDFFSLPMLFLGCNSVAFISTSFFTCFIIEWYSIVWCALFHEQVVYHPLVNIWAALTFWLLWIIIHHCTVYENSCTVKEYGCYLDMLLIFSNIHPRVKFFDVIVFLCLSFDKGQNVFKVAMQYYKPVTIYTYVYVYMFQDWLLHIRVNFCSCLSFKF